MVAAPFLAVNPREASDTGPRLLTNNSSAQIIPSAPTVRLGIPTIAALNHNGFDELPGLKNPQHPLSLTNPRHTLLVVKSIPATLSQVLIDKLAIQSYLPACP